MVPILPDFYRLLSCIALAFVASLCTAADVFDNADLLNEAQEQQISERLDELTAATRAPFILVTIPELPAEAQGNLQAYTAMQVQMRMPPQDEMLLQNWGRYILFIVTVSEGKATYQMGGSWPPSQVAAARKFINDEVQPKLQQGDTLGGLEMGYRGMIGLAETITTRHDGYWEIFKQAELNALVKLFLGLTTFSIVNPFLYIALIYAVIIILETFFPWRKDQPRNRPMLWLDITYTLVNYVLFWGLIGTALATVASIAYEDALYYWFGITNPVAVQLDNLPVWVRMLLAFLFAEFNSYWVHRLLHGTDLFWQIHKVHHSSTQLDIFNAARMHVFEPMTYQTLTYVPVVMIGFGVGETFIVGYLIAFFCNFTHANCRLRIGPLKYIINTPQLHLWHHAHATDERPTCNFGSVLSMWDFIFGTAYDPNEQVESPPMAFEGVEQYPTGYLSQFVAPITGMAEVVKNKLDGLLSRRA